MKTTTLVLSAFCALELMGALASFSWFPGSCEYKYGQACNDAETVYNDYNALWKLQVAFLLSALMILGGSSDDDSAPTTTTKSQLYPVSFVWLVALIALANFCGVMMFGSFMVDGLMPTVFHFVSMLYSFGTFASLFYLAVHSAGPSSNDAKSTTTRARTMAHDDDGATSTKTYLTVVAAYFLLWVFLNSDGSECTEVILHKEDFTSLAAAHWNYWSVGTLENALIFVWTVLFPDVRARIVTCHALALMQLVALAVVYYLVPITTFDIQCKTTTSFVLMFLLAIWAARKDSRAIKSKTN